MTLLALAGCAPVGKLPPPPPSPGPLDEGLALRVGQLTEGIAGESRSSGLRAELGMLYEANGLHAMAAACYEQALALDPTAAKLWYRLAVSRHREGDLRGAIDAMDEVVRLDPTYAPAQARRATWLLEAGDVDEAQRAVDRMGSPADWEEEVVFVAARLHLARGETLAAQRLLRTSGLLEGRNAGYARQLLARAHLGTGDLEAARTTVRTASLTRPAFPDPWSSELAPLRMPARRLTRARRLMSEHRFEEALAMLEATARTLDDERVFNLLAQCYLRLGRSGEALEALEKALVIAPEHFATRLNSAQVLLLSAHGEPAIEERALEQVDEAIRLRPDSGEAHTVRGAILLTLGRPEDAVDAYARGWRLDARNSEQVLRAGAFLLRRGDWERACRLYEMLLETERENPTAKFGLARCSMESGDRVRARAILSELAAAKADPDRLAKAEARLRALHGQAP